MYVTVSEHPAACPACSMPIEKGDEYFTFPAPLGVLCEDCTMSHVKTA